MRVIAAEDFTFFYDMVSYTVATGATIDGGAAIHLLSCGAAVTPADDDAQRLADGVPAEEAPPEVPEQSDGPAADGGELDISGTIDQVLAWVGDDSERALAAHAAEEARGDKARTTLLSKLAEIGLD